MIHCNTAEMEDGDNDVDENDQTNDPPTSPLCSYVVIAMEALDQLLMACHSQSIKPFVESFLHMVAKLLESREPDLQVLGTNSVSPRTF